MAGIIDGEGCFTVVRHRMKEREGRIRIQHALKIIVVNTSLPLCEALRDDWGGRVRTRKMQNARWKQSYEWMVGSKEADLVIAEILPYLIVKRQQATLAVSFRETIGFYPHGSRGQYFLPDEVFVERERLAQAIKAANRLGPPVTS